MNAMSILKPFLDRPTDTQEHADEVARQVPTAAHAGGLADAFRSDKSPALGRMAASLSGGSNGQQQAGRLGQPIPPWVPARRSSVAGGALGRMVRGWAGACGGVPDATPISASDLPQLKPDQVCELAPEVQRQDHRALDRMSAFCAEHPEVVRVPGGAPLATALGQVATRMRR